MKVLFITPYPEGEAPSQRFRFEQYFRVLQKKGIQYDTESFISRKTWEILYQEGHLLKKALGILWGFMKRAWLMQSINRYDFIFLHREASPLGPPLFEWFIAKVLRKRIIYDFDDAIWLPNTSQSNRIAVGFKWHHKVGHICRWSHKVSCGNEYLRQYAAHYNDGAFYIPTVIDAEHLHNPALYEKNQQKKITIGWTGTHSTMKYLMDIVPILEKLEKEFDFDFLVISNHRPSLSLRSLVYLPWNKATEIQDLNKMDIGLMPLTDNAWAEGKCGFKALQYMAMEIPPLVSPVGVNKKIVQHGINGYECSTPEEWYAYLKKLLLSAHHRTELGKNGRKTVINSFSVAANTKDFLNLFG